MAWRTKKSLCGGRSSQVLFMIRSKRIPNIHTTFAVDPHQKMRSAFGTGWSAKVTREHLRVNLSVIENHAISTELSNVNRESIN